MADSGSVSDKLQISVVAPDTDNMYRRIGKRPLKATLTETAISSVISRLMPLTSIMWQYLDGSIPVQKYEIWRGKRQCRGRLAEGGMAGANSGQLSDRHARIVTGGDIIQADWPAGTALRSPGVIRPVKLNGYYYNGGLVGFNSSTGNISNSYPDSTINGNSRTGGLVGQNEGTSGLLYRA